jgi:hypothetical protein
LVKPSELPEHAVIEHHEYGRFIKENHRWIEVSPEYREPPHVVSDMGYSNLRNRPANFIEAKSDDYFSNFDVLSVPMGWVYPGVEKEVVAWYDLGKQHVVRKTTTHEVIEDHPDLKEEDIATAEPKPVLWWDIPGLHNYETCVSGRKNTVWVRTKKTGTYRNRRENGFFVLYDKRKRVLWCEGELGTAEQIESFYKTGVVG